EGVEEGIIRGMYKLRSAPSERPLAVQILASGPFVNKALDAQRILDEQFEVAADVWSVTSYQQLRHDALAVERWNRLHPAAEQRVPYVTGALEGARGPVVAVSDFVKAVPDLISRWVPSTYTVLGTD